MRWEPLIGRAMIVYVIGKGATVGAVVIAVLHSGLPPFAQALIIAVVSASIGAAGMIIGALLAARATGQMIRRQDETLEHVRDVAGAVGADKRRRDLPNGDPS